MKFQLLIIDKMLKTKTFIASKLSDVVYIMLNREHSGSVVERLTRDRGAPGSSLTGVTILCP